MAKDSKKSFDNIQADPVLAHMRQVAYGPFIVPQSKPDDIERMAKAQAKRARRAAKRRREL